MKNTTKPMTAAQLLALSHVVAGRKVYMASGTVNALLVRGLIVERTAEAWITLLDGTQGWSYAYLPTALAPAVLRAAGFSVGLSGSVDC
jgi:hypothetical protein